jgi:hypothetical protein
LLKGDGSGHFAPLTMQQSGILIPGDGKSLVKLQAADGALLVASGQNRGKLGLFERKNPGQTLEAEPGDCAAIVHLQDGRSYREEIPYGSSYLSHSGRRLWLPENVASVEMIRYNGDKREIRTFNAD